MTVRRRTLAPAAISGGLAAWLAFLPGCGGSTPEVDNAELIRKDAPKTNEPNVPKPAAEPAPAPEAPKE